MDCRRTELEMASLAAALAGAALALALVLGGCGAGAAINLTITAGSGGGSGGSAIVLVDGSVESHFITGTADENGCVHYDFQRCQGIVCGFEPGSAKQLVVTCDDPFLAEWPDRWTLLEARWRAPTLADSGDIQIEPATTYILPPQYGAIVTDPGFSAWVLRLDRSSLPPTQLELRFGFDLAGDLAGCVKALVVSTVDPLVPDTGPRFIVPTEGLGADFTRFAAPDPHVFCFSAAVATEATTWHRVKSLFR